MRTIITGSSFLVIFIVTILIHCTIIGNNARENEIKNGLDNSIDYAYDKMMDYYTDPNFINYYKTTNEDGKVVYNNAIITDLLDKFCNVLQQRLGSNGVLSVQLSYIDLDTGTFTIKVTENFTYPFMKRKGTCMNEKTYSLY